MQQLKKFLATTCIVGLSVFLSSCILTSINPLAPRAEALRDTDLLGVWHAVNEETDDDVYLSVLDIGESGIKVISFSNADEAVLEMEGHVSAIGKDRYMNLSFIKNIMGIRQPDAFFFFAHYRITPEGRLALYLFNEDFFVKAVKEGKLSQVAADAAGEGRMHQDLLLDSSTAELVAFLKKQKPEDYLIDPVLYDKMTD